MARASVSVSTWLGKKRRREHRDELFRGGFFGAEIEIVMGGTYGELQGRVQQLLDDY